MAMKRFCILSVATKTISGNTETWTEREISTHFHLHCNKYDISLPNQNDWRKIYLSQELEIFLTVTKEWHCNRTELKSNKQRNLI